MAWTTGFGTLGPGAATRWWYAWGSDQGVQVARGNPLNPNAELVSYDFSERIEGSTTVYRVSIRNAGTVSTNFNLQGGGVT